MLRHILRDHGYPAVAANAHFFSLDAKQRRYTNYFRDFSVHQTELVSKWRVAREWNGEVKHTPWRGVFSLVLMPAAIFQHPGKRTVPHLMRYGIERYAYRVVPAGLLDMLPCSDAWRARTHIQCTILAMHVIPLECTEYVYALRVDSVARTLTFELLPYHSEVVDVFDYCLFLQEARR